jgi:hypothetical protein
MDARGRAARALVGPRRHAERPGGGARLRNARGQHRLSLRAARDPARRAGARPCAAQIPAEFTEQHMGASYEGLSDKMRS